MAKSAILTLKILADAKDAQKGLDTASRSVGKFESGINKMAGPAAGVAVAIGGIGKAAVDAASAQEQAFGAINSVFGENAKIVEGWASTSSKDVGISKTAYMEMASSLGAQLNNLTGDADVALSGTQDLITLGADLAATFGGTTTDAVAALSSALRGEADPAEKYGLALNQTTINAELAARGLDDLEGNALTAAKAQVTMELASKQAGDAVGAFARESDTAAGASQIAAATFEDTKAALGEALLPAVTKVTQAFTDMAKFVQDNIGAFKILIGVAGGVAGAILAIAAAFKIYDLGVRAVTAAQKIWTNITKIATKVQKALNLVLRANPIGLVITAVMLLIGAIALLWNKSDAFRAFVTNAWETIAGAAITAWEAIKSIIKTVLDWAKPFIEGFKKAVNAVWNAIKSVASTVWNVIKTVIKGVLDFVKAYITVWKTVIVAVWTAIKVAASAVWNAIKAIIKTVLDWVRTYINAWKAVINAVWTAIKTVATGVWNAIKGAAKTALDWIKGHIQSFKDTVNGVWNSIKEVGTSIWGKIKSAAQTALDAIMWPINKVKDAVRAVSDAVSDLIGWLGRIKMPKVLTDIGNKVGEITPWSVVSVTPPRPAPLPVSSAPTMSPMATSGATAFAPAQHGGATINVTVNGALDPDAVARQVERLLIRLERRRGGIMVGQR